MGCLCIRIGKLLKCHLKGKTCMDSIVAKFAILFVVTIIFIYIVLFNHPVLQITFVLLSPCSN